MRGCPRCAGAGAAAGAAWRRLSFDSASAWELDVRVLVRGGFKTDLVEFDGQWVRLRGPWVRDVTPRAVGSCRRRR